MEIKAIVKRLHRDVSGGGVGESPPCVLRGKPAGKEGERVTCLGSMLRQQGRRGSPQLGESLLVVVNVSLCLPLELLGKVLCELLVIVLPTDLLARGVDDLCMQNAIQEKCQI